MPLARKKQILAWAASTSSDERALHAACASAAWHWRCDRPRVRGVPEGRVVQTAVLV